MHRANNAPPSFLIPEPGEPVAESRRFDTESVTAGRSVKVNACTTDTAPDDDCLDPTEQRAWSSPIFVEYAPDEPSPRPQS